MTNKAALEFMRKMAGDSFSNSYEHEVYEFVTDMLKRQKVGKWIFSDTGIKFMNSTLVMGTCSVCAFKHDFLDGHTSQYQYCPSCGAKMEET